MSQSNRQGLEYLAVSLDESREQAVARFVERYGRRPREVFVDNTWLVGPVKPGAKYEPGQNFQPTLHLT
jgi:hypothetical protein